VHVHHAGPGGLEPREGLGRVGHLAEGLVVRGVGGVDTFMGAAIIETGGNEYKVFDKTFNNKSDAEEYSLMISTLHNQGLLAC